MTVKEFKTENKQLSILLEEREDAAYLNWTGKCTMLYPADFLTPILDEAMALNKKIVINFTRLEFITSSALNPIIRIMDNIKHSNGVIEVQYDKYNEWQEMHFSALRVFCTFDGRVQVNAV